MDTGIVPTSIEETLLLVLSTYNTIINNASQSAGKIIESTALTSTDEKISIGANIALILKVADEFETTIIEFFGGLPQDRQRELIFHGHHLAESQYAELYNKSFETVSHHLDAAKTASPEPMKHSRSSDGVKPPQNSVNDSGDDDLPGVQEDEYESDDDIGFGDAYSDESRGNGEHRVDYRASNEEREDYRSNGEYRDSNEVNESCQGDAAKVTEDQTELSTQEELSGQQENEEPPLQPYKFCLTAAEAALSNIPYKGILETNNAFLRSYRRAANSTLSDPRQFLIAGRYNAHSSVLICIVDIVHGQRGAADIELAGKSFGNRIQETVKVIKEAKRIKAENAFSATHSNGDPTNSIMNMLHDLDKAFRPSSTAEDTSPLALAAESAYNEAGFAKRGSGYGKDWKNSAPFSKPVICATSLIGYEVVTFRVLALIPLSELEKNTKIIVDGGETERPHAMIVLLKELGAIVCNEDISHFNILMVYENVLVPAIHDPVTYYDAASVASFLCAEICYADRWVEEWRISERPPLTQTLAEAGGRDAIFASLQKEDAAALAQLKAPKSYFAEMKLSKTYRRSYTNLGKIRRKAATSCAFSALLATQMVESENSRGFVYSLLCSPVSSFCDGKHNRYDFLLDDKIFQGDVDDLYAQELKKELEYIMQRRAKGAFEHIYYERVSNDDNEESSEDMLAITREVIGGLERHNRLLTA